MKLYHGSPVQGIVTLQPSKAEHGTAVFLTDNPTLAAIYAHPNHVWYTYCFNKEGKLGYDEVFPDQFRRMYQGHRGYVYTVDAAHARQHPRMPWVYMAEATDTAECLVIPDLYEHLCGEIDAGRLLLRRHEDMPEKTLASYRRMTVAGLRQEGHLDDSGSEYARFVQQYMPELWEEAAQAPEG